MSYVFVDLEKALIYTAAGFCKGMKVSSNEIDFEAVDLQGRNCVPFYEALSRIVGDKLSGGADFDRETLDALRSAKLWLDVAIDANGGQGAYSALIRAYTLRQGVLRLNEVFSENEIQHSSNRVAVNFVNTLIYGSKEHNLAPWTVPSISQIAAIDASAIGIVLFRQKAGIDDTAASYNAGWSGTIGFSLLGGKTPYETWRLISAGDPGSDIKGQHELAKVNRLDDYKNILFSVDAYSVALRAVIKNFGVNTFESLLSVIPEQINIAFASGNLNPLIQYIVKDTPVSPVIDLIVRYGLNDFFDMFRRTYDGHSITASTTDETFVANAYAFFSAIPPAQAQRLVTRTIGEYGNVSAWVELACEATPVGLALRNSLKQLSEIVIERDDGFPGRELELYDPQTGEGFITRQWLEDRADMLTRLISRSNGAFGENTLQKFSYTDIASGEQASMTTGVSNPMAIFADDGGRSFGGGSNADHLHGGHGNDSITGFVGNDVIEGAGGNDCLEGNEGNDTLSGMAGDDTLLGGKGNDSLNGGHGHDRYAFSSGDGIDEITDADGDGQLLINGLPIPALKRSSPLSNTWLAEDQSVAATLIEDIVERTLNIQYGASDLIVIKNFKPGLLGIRLPEYQRQFASPPERIVQGDWKAKDLDPAVPGEQPAYDELGNEVLLPKVKQRNKPDLLYGSPGHDVILGLGGSDRLFGMNGNDRLFGDKPSTLEKALAGGTGKGKARQGDWLDGGQGDDLLIGTPSRDVLLGGTGRDTLIGGAGDDHLSGDDATRAHEQDWDFKQVDVLIGAGVTSHRNEFSKASLNEASQGDADVLYGQGGRDVLRGGWGEDLLDGGTEDDWVAGGAGSDTLIGGSGDDTLLGDNLDWVGGLQSRHHGNDVLNGGNGNDLMYGNAGHDVLYGGPGNDLLQGDDDVLNGVAGNAADFFGNDLLAGGAGDDTLIGGGADDLLLGGAGNDDLAGDYTEHPLRYHGDDFLDGGSGDDSLRGLGGCDTLIGGAGADSLDGDLSSLQAGEKNDDVLQGGDGNDTLWGGWGCDTLYGGADDDVLFGDYEQSATPEHGADLLHGGSGNDTLLGGGGNDTLSGGDGKDYLRGDSGDNVFEGGGDNDFIEGSDGDDIYCFAAGDGLDVVVDAGGSNTLKFGAGFSAQTLKVDFFEMESGQALRLSNGAGDAVLIKDQEKWQRSTFSFEDGTSLSYQDVIKRTRTQADNSGLPLSIALVKEQKTETGTPVTQIDAAVESAIPTANEIPDTEFDWAAEFLSDENSKRSSSRLAAGFTLNEEGAWIRHQVVTDDGGYTTHIDVIRESFESGSVSQSPPWMNAPSGDAVFSQRRSETSAQSAFADVRAGTGEHSSSQKPVYYRAGSGTGFSFNTGDVVVEDRNASGAIVGWYIYPGTDLGPQETVRKELRRNVITETIQHQIVHGDDNGGRVNVEVGSLFHGGVGDDLLVAYSGSGLDYGVAGARTPGAYLSAGAGNDTLQGSEGADVLVSGSGEDWLYGENGADTYIVQAHVGAITVIADVLNPVFHRPEVGITGWKDEYGASDTDTVVLPQTAKLDALELSWGTALLETVNTELAPNPKKDHFRQPPRALMVRSTLNIKWDGSQQIRIVMPEADDLAGSGIELLKFADGTSVTLQQLLKTHQSGDIPSTHQGILVTNAPITKSLRDQHDLPLVGSHGNDTLNGAGEIRGMQGDDQLSGSAGNDIYVYDGLGRDVVAHTGGGVDAIDFAQKGITAGQLKFHRQQDDLVIVVDYGMSPKIRVLNHFSGGDSAIGFIRVRSGSGATDDIAASTLAERLHPLPPLRDVEDILLKNDEDAARALTEIINFYGLDA